MLRITRSAGGAYVPCTFRAKRGIFPEALHWGLETETLPFHRFRGQVPQPPRLGFFRIAPRLTSPRCAMRLLQIATATRS
jgi:hypothetical protein